MNQRVRILRNLGAEWPVSWREGEIVDAQALTDRLIAAGLAEAVPPEPVERLTTTSDVELKTVPPAVPQPPKRGPGRPAKQGFEGT